MIRQRVNIRRGAGALLVRAVTVLFALALVYGGVLDALLALKLHNLGPAKIDQISGYRTAYHWLAGLHASQFTTAISLIAGFGGLIVFLFFASLVLGAVPRPYFTRTDIDLPQAERGATVVRPRALERIAEVAARGNDHVIGATGRLGDGSLHVDVGVDTPRGLDEALADVRRRIGEELVRHDLPRIPVNVTLTGYEPTRREPS